MVDHHTTTRCRIAVPRGRRPCGPKAAWVYGADRHDGERRHDAAHAGSALPNTQYRRRVPPQRTADRTRTRGACAHRPSATRACPSRRSVTPQRPPPLRPAMQCDEAVHIASLAR
jgi:hypothetical protein